MDGFKACFICNISLVMIQALSSQYWHYTNYIIYKAPNTAAVKCGLQVSIVGFILVVQHHNENFYPLL